jgi:HlyD family secretion protein
MQVDTNVDEADIGRVRVGHPATFTVDAYPGETFGGKVVQIRQAAMNIQNVITYDAVIAVANPDLKLFPGMTANVKILVDRRENALKIPNAALRFRPPDVKEQFKQGGNGSVRTSQGSPTGGWAPGLRDTRKTGGDQTIWVLGEDRKPRPVTLKLGITDGSFSEVTEGTLDIGQDVIVGVLSKDGQTASGPAQPFGQRGPRF